MLVRELEEEKEKRKEELEKEKEKFEKEKEKFEKEKEKFEKEMEKFEQEMEQEKEHLERIMTAKDETITVLKEILIWSKPSRTSTGNLVPSRNGVSQLLFSVSRLTTAEKICTE